MSVLRGSSQDITARKWPPCPLLSLLASFLFFDLFSVLVSSLTAMTVAFSSFPSLADSTVVLWSYQGLAPAPDPAALFTAQKQSQGAFRAL